MVMKQINGGCHCGQVTYQAVVDDTKVMICHCEDCQVLSGTVYRTIVIADSDNLQITGSVKNYIKTAESGRSRIQAFCPECGTHLYASSADGKPEVYNLRVGTIEQRQELKPAVEIWCDSAMNWNGLLPETKKIAKQP